MSISEETRGMIRQEVEAGVDKKINGKLIGIKAQLDAQDKILGELKVLLEDKDFLTRLWKFIKAVGAGLMSLGGAWYLYNQITGK